MSLSTVIALRKIDDRIVRAETSRRVSLADARKYDRWLEQGHSGFGHPIDPVKVEALREKALKDAARYQRAADKAHREAAALL